MSFSMDIKQELIKIDVEARHCQIAELTAILTGCCDIRLLYGNYAIRLISESKPVVVRFEYLIDKLFGVKVPCLMRNSKQYALYITDHKLALKVLQITKVVDISSEICENIVSVSRTIISGDCCKRAYLRAGFLGFGSMSDPNKIYHLEFVCKTKDRADMLCEMIESLGIKVRSIIRKNNYLVYIKESKDIVDLLGYMGAHRALLELMNVRVVKTVRNDVNRRVNCEAANLNKIISASVKEIEDIRYIFETKGMDYLPENLREIAKIRLENPESSLKEIGQMLEPPLGKSGVNHRLKKISTIVEELRGKDN
ncbi:MAG TPA: DNA-binding protein WhiA [Eubacterium sp.]|nr:DNA-binding protein WhiA [Eubacterium sp.]HBZ52781.1 DNA-binding protein WhiA [Eubacterium sp.]